jgi:hypothetical protein
MLRSFGWVLVGTLLAAAAYELALALGAWSVGPEPGDGVAGSGEVMSVALLAMLAAAVIGPFPSVRPWPAALLAPAAVAFLVAFYFTYDPYYAPDLRRYSDGNVGDRWIWAVAAIALADGVLTRLQPRLGRITTSLVLVGVLVTTALAGDGH